jgi:hypothetical protein
MRPSVLLLSAFVLGALSPSTARAADGVLLVQSISDGAKTTATSSQVQMEPNRIRAEVHDGDGRRQVVIFDAVNEVLYIVDAARKSYIELTKADAAKMGSMMSGAMAMMQQQMANLPPAQRAMLEQQMAGMMGGGATAVARPTYKRNGVGKAGERACDRYDGYTAGQKTSEICTVAPEALGFALADFAVLNKLSDFVRTIMPQMADQIVGVGSPEQGFSGLPVRSAATDPRSGRTITIQLTDARRATFEDAIFRVPAGFTKQAMPMMGQ